MTLGIVCSSLQYEEINVVALRFSNFIDYYFWNRKKRLTAWIENFFTLKTVGRQSPLNIRNLFDYKLKLQAYCFAAHVDVLSDKKASNSIE